MNITGLRAEIGAAILLAGMLLCGCHAKKTPEKNRPWETLNTIVSEVILYRKTDFYRTPYPSDAEGKNLFVGAIARLDDWARLNPNQCVDIVSYSRGLCCEKLARLGEAEEQYGLAVSGDPELVALAAKRKEVMADLQRYFSPGLKSSAPNEQAMLDQAAQDRADEAVRKYKGTEWESLAMICAENRAVEDLLALKARRSTVGEAVYRGAIESLILVFKESKRIQEHRLRLGIYYEEEAREWITRAENKEGADDWKIAQEALDKAMEIYVKIAQADGYLEKREAQARLDAVEELARKIEKNQA